MGRFELWLTADTGERIKELSTGLGFSGSKVANNIGWFTYVPPKSFNRSLLKPDRMLQMWYAPNDGDLRLFNTYFLRHFKYKSKGIEFSGPDQNSLLTRRIVAAYSTSAAAKYSATPADNIMKAVVLTSMIDSVDPTPDFGTRAWANLTVQVPDGQGPVISSSFPFKKLLTMDGGGVLPILAKAAKELGTEVFFSIDSNVVNTNSINYEFRTKIGQPGQDVSADVTFDEASGNLIDPVLDIDYTNEANYIYATGQGERENREVQQVWDAARIGQSIWGRIEEEADSRNQDDANSVLSSGYSALWDGRPKIKFTGKPADVKGTQFGKHWWFGDVVTTKFEFIQFQSIIRAVSISVNQNGEQSIDTRLDYES